MKLLKFILFISLVTLNFAEEKEGASTSASMGSVTMDGKIYNQVAVVLLKYGNGNSIWKIKLKISEIHKPNN